MGRLANCGELFLNWGRFLWDSQQRTVLGRTKRAWAEIGSFFVVLYILLFSYCLSMVSIFYFAIDEREPSLLGDDSFLGIPGIGIRPRLLTHNEKNYMSTITFSSDANYAYHKHIIKSLKDALKPYKEAHDSSYAKFYKQCSDEGNSPDKLQSCIVNYDHLTDAGCLESNSFGYTEGKPCVMLRLNKIYGWMPKPYKKADKSMPDALKAVVNHHYYQNIHGSDGPQHLIWVHCYGKDDYDKDNLGNNTQYIPQQGFPASYYPYLNQFKFLQPVVLVKFNSLAPNVVVKVHCKAYAKNIKFSTKTWEGGFHFELYFRKKK